MITVSVIKDNAEGNPVKLDKEESLKVMRQIVEAADQDKSVITGEPDSYHSLAYSGKKPRAKAKSRQPKTTVATEQKTEAK